MREIVFLILLIIVLAGVLLLRIYVFPNMDTDLSKIAESSSSNSSIDLVTSFNKDTFNSNFKQFEDMDVFSKDQAAELVSKVKYSNLMNDYKITVVYYELSGITENILDTIASKFTTGNTYSVDFGYEKDVITTLTITQNP